MVAADSSQAKHSFARYSDSAEAGQPLRGASPD
jgi:hypothetical protein